MTVKRLFGDVFDHLDPNSILVHGCNAQHAMGSGIAGQIRKKYPQAYYDYMATPVLNLGDVIFTCIDSSNNIWIANAITQEYFGSDGRKYADLSAIKKALIRVKEFDKKYTIVMPEIGCGLGGLTVEEVFPIVDNVYNDEQLCKIVTWKN